MSVGRIKDYPQVQLDFSPNIPPLKKGQKRSDIDVRYPLIAPFAFVHIYWDDSQAEMMYEIAL